MDMTPEERRASLAAETEDVSREDQIFIEDALGYNLENSEKDLTKDKNNDIFAEQNKGLRNDNRGKQYASESVSRTFEEAKRELDASTKNRGNTEAARGKQQDAGKAELLGTLERLAKRNGAWIERPEELISFEVIGKGFENEVFPSINGNDVIKFNNLSVSGTLDNFLDRIKAHNEFAPNAAYKIIGFAENGMGEVCVVLEQPYVRDAELATQDEIDNWLSKHGFTKSDNLTSGLKDGWTNGKYNICATNISKFNFYVF
jgi:hypothetical protein